MNDKKIKEAMKQYIETQADNISSESEEKHNLTSLDEKVYAMLGTNQNKHKTAAVWSFRKISALAATFVLVISLSITFQTAPPLNDSGDSVRSRQISFSLSFQVPRAFWMFSTIQLLDTVSPSIQKAAWTRSKRLGFDFIPLLHPNSAQCPFLRTERGAPSR